MIKAVKTKRSFSMTMRALEAFVASLGLVSIVGSLFFVYIEPTPDIRFFLCAFVVSVAFCSLASFIAIKGRPPRFLNWAHNLPPSNSDDDRR